jgi:hypothetical protein
MLIPGPKLNQVFASRWKALFWALTVLLSAYLFVPRADEKKGGDAAAIAAVAGGGWGAAGSPASPAPATSPWAK